MNEPNFDRFSPLPTPSAREERVNDENGELRERIEELEGELDEMRPALTEAKALLNLVCKIAEGTDFEHRAIIGTIQQFLKPEGGGNG